MKLYNIKVSEMDGNKVLYSQTRTNYVKLETLLAHHTSTRFPLRNQAELEIYLDSLCSDKYRLILLQQEI